MDDANVKEDVSHHTDETLARRFAWLIGVLDQNLDRADAVRRTSYQKATWTLATATGWVGLLVIVKGESISTLIRLRLTNQTVAIDNIEKMVVLGSMLLALTYIALLNHVIKVYSPRKILYPYSLRKKETSPPISMSEDEAMNLEFRKESWANAIEAYIKPDDLQNNHELLWEYIKVYTEHQALILGMDDPLRYAFILLRCTAIISIALLVLS